MQALQKNHEAQVFQENHALQVLQEKTYRRCSRKAKSQYGIVLDAGSSHTALFVYKWPADKENDTGIASDRVLEAVVSTLKEYPFDFRGARILSGEDEGVFGWVTANYLLENFIKYGWIGQWVRPKKKTLGAMDLGGASTQITFETPEEIESRPANAVTLRLYGQTYKVYTHSCKVCAEGGEPLLAAGLRQKFQHGQRLQLPLHRQREAHQLLPHGHREHERLRERKTAFSAFFYTVDFIQSEMKRRVTTPRDLEEAAAEICNSTWSELYEKAPKMEKFLADYCPMANFVYLILMEGYKFNDTNFPDITFQKKMFLFDRTGWGHVHRLGFGIHAQPHQHDPCGGDRLLERDGVRPLGWPGPALGGHHLGVLGGHLVPPEVLQGTGDHVEEEGGAEQSKTWKDKEPPAVPDRVAWLTRSSLLDTPDIRVLPELLAVRPP
ncbi:hypothetical protein JD844_005078 [Phrynosoma platyrhinos]|uniref:Ectonucleoside triphosphate diphosphohydrolase 2 n=1 Tax=Phrynosoma platyrhinos TaxID=52577 RepID=A0ABQ7SE72_PHRPL|nr:hypothetical protein JD844_005078 [Phrynosoma platyrhinos]